jgi:hypothetical protein
MERPADCEDKNWARWPEGWKSNLFFHGIWILSGVSVSRVENKLIGEPPQFFCFCSGVASLPRDWTIDIEISDHLHQCKKWTQLTITIAQLSKYQNSVWSSNCIAMAMGIVSFGSDFIGKHSDKQDGQHTWENKLYYLTSFFCYRKDGNFIYRQLQKHNNIRSKFSL